MFVLNKWQDAHIIKEKRSSSPSSRKLVQFSHSQCECSKLPK
jgi:hypothetical protein